MSMNRIFSSEDVIKGLIQASKEVTDDDQMAGVLTAGANILGVSEDTVNSMILSEEV